MASHNMNNLAPPITPGAMMDDDVTAAWEALEKLLLGSFEAIGGVVMGATQQALVLYNPVIAKANDVTRNRPRQTSKFACFPTELIKPIFEYLDKQEDKCTIMCLGLTSTRFNAIMRDSIKPGIIDLKQYVWGEKDGKQVYYSLATLLEGWMGAKYRRIKDSYYMHFVSRAVFGDVPGQKQLKLEERYKARRGIHASLPSPLNKGDDWYPEAARIMRAKFKRYQHRESGYGRGRSQTDHPLLAPYRQSSLCTWVRQQVPASEITKLEKELAGDDNDNSDTNNDKPDRDLDFEILVRLFI